MFRQVPDADYVYCESSGLLLATEYVRFCYRVWEVALTAHNWGELADRLIAIEPEFAEFLFPDGLDDYFSAKTSGHERADSFDARSQADYDSILPAFPFGGGDDHFATWWEDLPEEVVDLLGDEEYFYSETLKAALEIVSSRGEIAIEDCALIDEVTGPPCP